MQPSIRKVIALWLEENEFDTSKDEFSKKKEVKPLVISLKSQIKNTKSFDLNRFKDDCNQIVNLVNGTEGLLGKQYFSDLLKSQISMLQCPHELDHHKIEIIRNSRWMVAEFMRQGFDEKALGGLDGIFRRLVKFGQLKDKEKARKADFPLPEDLRLIKDSPEFEAALENYLGGNHFKTQFDGMFNALSEKRRANIYFLIGGLEMDENISFEFQYQKCEFFSSDKFAVEIIDVNEKNKADIAKCFINKGALIAKVTLDVKSVTKALIRANYEITRTLEALRYYVGKDGGVVINNKVLILYDNGGFRLISKMERDLELTNNDLEFIKKSNYTIPGPDNVSDENQKFLVSCHRIFFKGLSSKEPDDIITCFWQYWEAAFYFYGGSNKGERIITDLGLILAKDKAKDMKIDLGFLLYTYAMNNCGSNTFGISPDFYMKRCNSKLPDDLEDILFEIKELTTYPFLVNLVDRYYSIDESEDIKWYRFYTKLLWQLYEQRNSIHHDGTYCDTTLEQLRFYFRTTVVRWQSKLFTEMDKTPELGIEEIIMKMKEKSKI